MIYEEATWKLHSHKIFDHLITHAILTMDTMRTHSQEEKQIIIKLNTNIKFP